MIYAVNTFLNKIHSFAHLQVSYSPEELIKWDTGSLQTIQKSPGLTSKDASHIIFPSGKNMGLGIKSFMETDLQSTARELEVILNGVESDSKGEWKLFKIKYPPLETLTIIHWTTFEN